ncbi:hypothetical protein DFJ74DRAFT_141200 [Hyaloraphidium curvatum]|nr:hypothetical protein DFJ74DRAFT_141200 [Hyaloraphidium curvatum]
MLDLLPPEILLIVLSSPCLDFADAFFLRFLCRSARAPAAEAFLERVRRAARRNDAAGFCRAALDIRGSAMRRAGAEECLGALSVRCLLRRCGVRADSLFALRVLEDLCRGDEDDDYGRSVGLILKGLGITVDDVPLVVDNLPRLPRASFDPGDLPNVLRAPELPGKDVVKALDNVRNVSFDVKWHTVGAVEQWNAFALTDGPEGKTEAGLARMLEDARRLAAGDLFGTFELLSFWRSYFSDVLRIEDYILDLGFTWRERGMIIARFISWRDSSLGFFGLLTDYFGPNGVSRKSSDSAAFVEEVLKGFTEIDFSGFFDENVWPSSMQSQAPDFLQYWVRTADSQDALRFLQALNGPKTSSLDFARLRSFLLMEHVAVGSAWQAGVAEFLRDSWDLDAKLCETLLGVFEIQRADLAALMMKRRRVLGELQLDCGLSDVLERYAAFGGEAGELAARALLHGVEPLTFFERTYYESPSAESGAELARNACLQILMAARNSRAIMGISDKAESWPLYLSYFLSAFLTTATDLLTPKSFRELGFVLGGSLHLMDHGNDLFAAFAEARSRHAFKCRAHIADFVAGLLSPGILSLWADSDAADALFDDTPLGSMDLDYHIDLDEEEKFEALTWDLLSMKVHPVGTPLDWGPESLSERRERCMAGMLSICHDR